MLLNYAWGVFIQLIHLRFILNVRILKKNQKLDSSLKEETVIQLLTVSDHVSS